MILFLLLLLTVFFSPSLYGEEVYRLEEIVVSATKAEEERAEIPKAVIIKKTEDLEKSGPKSIGDLLANEPGIDWITYGDYGGASEALHIRGMRADGTQVFLNGISLNSPSLGSADIGKIPLENIEKIEVVKGSGSLLYGSGAMGGTVNIFTKSPKKDKIELKVNGGYGTENTYRLSFQQGMFFKNGLGYYLTGGRKETEGFRDNSNLRQNDGSLKILFDRSEKIKVSLYADYIEASYGVPGVKPPKGTEEYIRDGIRFYNDKVQSLLNHGREKNGNVVMEFKGYPKEKMEYNFKLFSSYMNNYFYQRYASTGKGDESWVINTVSGTEGFLNFYPVSGLKILFGGEYKEFGWRRENYGLDERGIRGEKLRFSRNIYTKALFSEAEYRPSKYFKFLLGLRQENHSAFGREYIPLFGFILNPSERAVIKVNTGRHFKAPTPNDLFWPEGMYEKGNPNLKPEIGWHSDVTYEHSLFNDKLFLVLSYFNWKVNRRIQWEPDANGVWSPINLEYLKADGAEVELKLTPVQNLSLSFGYTYTHAFEKSREYTVQDYGWPPYYPPYFEYSLVKRRATLVPQNLFKAEISYKTGFGLTTTLVARYVDDRIGTYRTEYITYPHTKTVRYDIDSYWTFDIRLKQKFREHFVLTFDAKNLFDKEYVCRLGTFYNSKGKGYISPYPGPGRSFFLTLSYEY